MHLYENLIGSAVNTVTNVFPPCKRMADFVSGNILYLPDGTAVADKYSQCVNSVTIIHGNGVIHFGNRMTCVIIYCPQQIGVMQHIGCFLHKMMLQGIKNYQYKVSMQDLKDDHFYSYFLAFFCCFRTTI